MVYVQQNIEISHHASSQLSVLPVLETEQKLQ
jgi:hypothetical protein